MTDVLKRELDMKRRQAEKRATVPQERRSKYRAVKTVVDGVTFASKAEARRYQELLARVAAGEIRNLELQPRFRLTVGQGFFEILIGVYVADFRYEERKPRDVADWCDVWSDRIEDVKGFDVPLGRWKRKHAEAQYAITIRIIK